MPKILDISLTITPDLPVWPGDPAVILERIHEIEEGANSNVSRLDLGVHTGTHVDAPLHFLPGHGTVDQLDLNILTGPACVIELPESCKMITAEVLDKAGIPSGTQRLLLKTRNSVYWTNPDRHFHTDFVGVDLSGSEYLVNLGIRLVGIDYLSISPYKKSRPTHEALLKANVIIIEGLDLSQVAAGNYQLVCLPLKLGGAEGAPARAILIEG